MPLPNLGTDTQRPRRTITLAFLACGCRTVYDDCDHHDGEVVVCPNLYICDGHDDGWTSIIQTLAGSLRSAAHAIPVTREATPSARPNLPRCACTTCR